MIYLDNHSTTRCDPRVVQAMLPWLDQQFANPHSTHAAGIQAADAIDLATAGVAAMLGAKPDHIVFTSGATESNNLAIRGACLHPRQKRRRIVTVATEHPAVLDVALDLKRDGFDATIVPVIPCGNSQAGIVDLDRLADAVDEQTALVSVMWANNEMGAIAPLEDIAAIAHQSGALLHSDATQAVGRIPIDMSATDVDLLSARPQVLRPQRRRHLDRRQRQAAGSATSSDRRRWPAAGTSQRHHGSGNDRGTRNGLAALR